MRIPLALVCKSASSSSSICAMRPRRTRPLLLLALAATLTAPYWLLPSCSSLIFYITGAAMQQETMEPRLMDCVNDSALLLSTFFFDQRGGVGGGGGGVGGQRTTYAVLRQPVDSATLGLSPACAAALLSKSSPADSSVIAASTDEAAPSSAAGDSCFSGSVSAPDQARAYSVLSQLQRNFSQRGLELILSDGSLLGSVRHFGFIPWDDDVDFLIRRDQRAEVWQLLVELSAWDQFQFVDTESINEHWKLGIMCSADRSQQLEMLYGTGLQYPVKECKLQVDLFFGGIAGQYYTRREKPFEFPFGHYYPLTMRPFGPHLMPAPRDAEAVLVAVYGPGCLSSCTFSTHSNSQLKCKRPQLACSELRQRYQMVSRLKLRLPPEEGAAADGAFVIDADVLLASRSQLVAIYIPRQ